MGMNNVKSKNRKKYDKCKNKMKENNNVELNKQNAIRRDINTNEVNANSIASQTIFDVLNKFSSDSEVQDYNMKILELSLEDIGEHQRIDDINEAREHEIVSRRNYEIAEARYQNLRWEIELETDIDEWDEDRKREKLEHFQEAFQEMEKREIEKRKAFGKIRKLEKEAFKVINKVRKK